MWVGICGSACSADNDSSNGDLHVIYRRVCDRVQLGISWSVALTRLNNWGEEGKFLVYHVLTVKKFLSCFLGGGGGSASG